MCRAVLFCAALDSVMFGGVPLLHISAALCNVDLCSVVLCCVVPCCVVLCSGVFPCCLYRLRCVVLAYVVMLTYVGLCCVVLLCVGLCCVVLRCVMLCCGLLLQVSAASCCVDLCFVVLC